MSKDICELVAHLLATIALAFHTVNQPEAPKKEAPTPSEVQQVPASAQPAGKPIDPQAIPEPPPEVVIGDIVIVEHYVSVYSSRAKEIGKLPTVSTSIGFVAKLDPDLVIAATRWPNVEGEDPEYHNLKRFRDELVVSINILDIEQGDP